MFWVANIKFISKIKQHIQEKHQTFDYFCEMRSIIDKSWLLYTNLQNKTLCWFLCMNLPNKTHYRRVTPSARLQKSQYKYIVSNPSWKLSPIIKLTIPTFWTKFAKKGSYFQSKTDKIDTTIEFCIFELVFVSNFTLNKQFWIFGPNLPKKDIYGQKQKKWTSSLNSAYSN